VTIQLAQLQTPAKLSRIPYLCNADCRDASMPIPLILARQDCIAANGAAGDVYMGWQWKRVCGLIRPTCVCRRTTWKCTGPICRPTLVAEISHRRGSAEKGGSFTSLDCPLR